MICFKKREREREREVMKMTLMRFKSVQIHPKRIFLRNFRHFSLCFSSTLLVYGGFVLRTVSFKLPSEIRVGWPLASTYYFSNDTPSKEARERSPIKTLAISPSLESVQRILSVLVSHTNQN